jgi:hypothetical protein
VKPSTLMLIALGCATPSLALALADQLPATVAWLLLEALVLGLGWHFFWSTVTRQQVLEVLGSRDQIAQSVPFPELPPLPVIACPPAKLVDLAALPPEYGLPNIDLPATMARMPALKPRDWRPSADSGTTLDSADYVASAHLDLAGELQRLDTAYRRSRRPQA